MVRLERRMLKTFILVNVQVFERKMLTLKQTPLKGGISTLRQLLLFQKDEKIYCKVLKISG